MTAALLPVPVLKFTDVNGVPLAGGLVYTYVTGTTTPLATYTDSTGTVANPNPVVLDSTGAASIWISGNYTINLTDANNVQQPNYPQNGVQDLFTADNVTATSTTSLTISSTSQTLAIQSGRYFPVGIFLLIVDNSDHTKWMHGQVTSYVGTELTVNVTTISGSGTNSSSWTVSLSGPVGPQGATGGTGTGITGPGTTVVGHVVLWNAVNGTTVSDSGFGLGSAAQLNVGTSANQIVQLNSSAQYPAGDGSLITDIAGIPSVSSGKLVIGALTLQWGTATSSPGGTPVSFGTAFSSTPYLVWGTSNVSNTFCPQGNYTNTGFLALGGNGAGGSTACQWVAIGPT